MANSRSNTRSGTGSPSCLRSSGSGNAALAPVTAGTASIETVMGIRFSSRGLSEFMWNPSGNRTVIAARAESPGRTSSAAGITANSATPGRVPGACADRTPPSRAARRAVAPTPVKTRIRIFCQMSGRPSGSCRSRTRSLKSPLFRDARNLFRYKAQWNHRRLRHLLHLDVVALDRRQVLEHRVPLPAFHRIAGLEPVFGAHNLIEGGFAEAGIFRTAGKTLRDIGAHPL